MLSRKLWKSFVCLLIQYSWQVNSNITPVWKVGAPCNWRNDDKIFAVSEARNRVILNLSPSSPAKWQSLQPDEVAHSIEEEQLASGSQN